MTILTLDQLIEIADNVIDYSRKYYPNYYYYFMTLRMTGCRPAEPLLRDLWLLEPDGSIVMQPLKNNNFRYFQPEDLPFDFYDMIVMDDFLFGESRQRSMLRAFNNSNRTGAFQTLNDRSSCYLFRYIKAKELFRDGKTLPEIQTIFGWKNENMARNYVEKNLYR